MANTANLVKISFPGAEILLTIIPQPLATLQFDQFMPKLVNFEWNLHILAYYKAYIHSFHPTMLQFSISLYQIDIKSVILQYLNVVGYILFENCRSLGSFSKENLWP